MLSILVFVSLITAGAGEAQHTPELPGVDPGFPLPNPTVSYWQLPPNERVARHQSSELPTEADVVIIGSGISGASIAWHLLTNNTGTAPKVAMLEAREACSGATGRNGGHIRPAPWSEYAEANERLGTSEAAKITRLRIAHVNALLEAVRMLPEEGRAAAEARMVDSIDAYFDEDTLETAYSQLQELRQVLPDIAKEYQYFEGEEARNISLLAKTTGIITGTGKVAGAVWPYRFVTAALEMLLDVYPSFSLDTLTPAYNVTILNRTSGDMSYAVTTSRGAIRAKHVVYATNAWSSHFLPSLRDRTYGLLYEMSAQMPGSGIPRAGHWPSYTNNGSLSGGRAWSLNRPDGSLDGGLQMPKTNVFMFGAGSLKSDVKADYDDTKESDHVTASYRDGALTNYFGYEQWGAETACDTCDTCQQEESIFPGRTKRAWTGIEGHSLDGSPYVGKIPETVIGRNVKAGRGGGEWLSGLFGGEGMCFAWLCGSALSQMILHGEGAAPDWFPSSLLPTDERLAGKSSASNKHSQITLN